MCENLNGKNIAVLGIKEVGKTTFLAYICKNEIIKDYETTPVLDKDSYKKFRFSGGDISFTLSSVDLPGSDDFDTQAVENWKKYFDSADIVIYLLRAHVLLNPQSANDSREIEIIKRNIRKMTEWREKINNKRKVFIVGSYFDKFGDFSDQTLSSYQKKFNENEIIRFSGMTPVIGSLVNKVEAEKLVRRLVNQW